MAGLLEKVKERASSYKGVKKCVLAYSGGLDTTVIISLLQELGIEVVTFTMEMGQKENLREIEEKAKKLGVKKTYSLDARKEFADEYLARAIKANCLYEKVYPCATALGRPIIVKHLVDIARKEGAQAVAHGSTGMGNDQVRFENGVRALAPDLKILAPVRDWEMWRDEEIEYAKQKGIPVSSAAKKYSIDENLWGRSMECGDIEKMDKEVPEDAFEWTTAPEKAPDKPAYVKIKFERGVPVEASVEGQKVVGLLNVIERLHAVAGANGVGRLDHLEDRVVGFKSRESYECPAASVLLPAHAELEKSVLTRDELRVKEYVDSVWSELVYSGKWFSPLREELDAFVDATQEPVSGTVTVKLFKGKAKVVARETENALYDLGLASYDKTVTRWSQAEGGAFTKLFGLQTAMAYAKRKKKK